MAIGMGHALRAAWRRLRAFWLILLGWYPGLGASRNQLQQLSFWKEANARKLKWETRSPSLSGCWIYCFLRDSASCASATNSSHCR